MILFSIEFSHNRLVGEHTKFDNRIFYVISSQSEFNLPAKINYKLNKTRNVVNPYIKYFPIKFGTKKPKKNKKPQVRIDLGDFK